MPFFLDMSFIKCIYIGVNKAIYSLVKKPLNLVKDQRKKPAKYINKKSFSLVKKLKKKINNW